MPDGEWLPPGRVFCWGGWGGSVAAVDLDRGVTLAFAMNKMDTIAMANRMARICLAAVYEALGQT